MKSRNLIEDEKQARYERYGVRLASVLIILGVIFFVLDIKKGNN
jgi:hypothetical protein